MKTRTVVAFASLYLLTGVAIVSAASATTAGKTATTPLTYANAISFFKAAKFRATEVQSCCAIFFEGEWKLHASSWSGLMTLVY